MIWGVCVYKGNLFSLKKESFSWCFLCPFPLSRMGKKDRNNNRSKAHLFLSHKLDLITVMDLYLGLLPRGYYKTGQTSSYKNPFSAKKPLKISPFMCLIMSPYFLRLIVKSSHEWYCAFSAINSFCFLGHSLRKKSGIASVKSQELGSVVIWFMS